MNLDEAQTARVRQWIDQGLKVAEVQSRLAEELGVRLTYMEARLLLDDLRLKPKDPPPAPKPSGAVLGASGGPAGGPPAGPSAPMSSGPSGRGGGPGPGGDPGLRTAPLGDAPAEGRVSVTVDEIARPSMVVSGKVTFSDGQTAEWGIDQMGQPMLIPKKQGYRPSRPDVLAFQTELEQVLGRMGMGY